MLIQARWLVIVATVVMLLMAVLGVLMGWRRINNTLSGWNKAIAWGLLPLIVLSSLTALFMASNVTFTGTAAPAGSAKGARLSVAQAVRILGERHDLSTLVWIRPIEGRLRALGRGRGVPRLFGDR